MLLKNWYANWHTKNFNHKENLPEFLPLMVVLKQCVNVQMARYMDGKPNIF